MKKANQDLRDYANANGVKLWQVAEAFGRSDAQFTRYMRIELGTEEKKAFMDAVDSIKKGNPTDVPKDFIARKRANKENAEIFDDENLNILRERLDKAVRKQESIAEVTRKIGVSYNALGNVLSGTLKTSPRIGTLIKIAKATNTSIDYLVGLSPINSQEPKEIIYDCMEKYQKFMTMFESLADDLQELREEMAKRYEYYAGLYAEQKGDEK